jgi:hypothetical protein
MTQQGQATEPLKEPLQASFRQQATNWACLTLYASLTSAHWLKRQG